MMDEKDILDAVKTYRVLSEINTERREQDLKWGEQNHPNGTHAGYWAPLRDAAREVCDGNAALGIGTWLDILREETYEAFAETNDAMLEKELIQAAAVIVAWIENIRRRRETNDDT